MSSPTTAFEGVLFALQRIRQAAREADPATANGVAIAFTSASSGEGVTHTVQALLATISRDPGSRTLLLDGRRLRTLSDPPEAIASLCHPVPGTGLYEFRAPEASQAQLWAGSWEYRRDVIAALRAHFDYILLDCPALRDSNDLLSLAPFADGIVLVVAADSTRRDQVLHAEKAIDFARGNLLGTILNKRSYVVPEWIYRRL